MPSPFNFRKYLAPRFWPLWLNFLLLRLMGSLPYRLQLTLGAQLGRLIYRLIPRRRHIAEVNIALCFPELSTDEQQKMVKACFRSAGIALFEIGLSWWGKKERLQPLAHIDGLHHFDAAIAQKSGVLLLGFHSVSLEIGGPLLALYRNNFSVVYKYHRNPLFEALMRHSREKYCEGAIERSDIRSLIRLLKKGAVCWYALDQDFGDTNAVFAPFMGVPAATLIATSRIAKLSGCSVVPYFIHRRSDGSGYQMTLHPALENFPSGDDLADATRTNALIETEIRRAPEQYLWLHRRFKTRPKGEPDVY